MTVVKTWVFGAAIVLTPIVAAAQQAQVPLSEMIRAQQKISLVEGAFERAVQNGVDNFSRQLQALAPGADAMAILMGAPQVRGFPMPPAMGGVFFDVQMPSLQLSMVWPLRYAQNADAASAVLAEVRSALERVTDPQLRVELNQKMRQLEMQMGSTSSRRRAGPTNVGLQSATAAPSTPALSPADMAILDDPAEAWRREVRSTLTDAMIENSGSVSIGPNEYLVVAARGVLSSDRLVADPGAARTMELRLKGSDLDALRKGTITLEEARKKVEFREY